MIRQNISASAKLDHSNPITTGNHTAVSLPTYMHITESSSVYNDGNSYALLESKSVIDRMRS